jgi:hypothetical protein
MLLLFSSLSKKLEPVPLVSAHDEFQTLAKAFSKPFFGIPVKSKMESMLLATGVPSLAHPVWLQIMQIIPVVSG